MEVLISSRNQPEFLCTINCKCLNIRNQLYVMSIHMSYMRSAILTSHLASSKAQRKCIKTGQTNFFASYFIVLFFFLTVMMTITIEDYETQYWPKLEGAIDQLLSMTPGQYIPISYEQMYRFVSISFHQKPFNALDRSHWYMQFSLN